LSALLKDLTLLLGAEAAAATSKAA
jgi:hypothetical protein